MRIALVIPWFGKELTGGAEQQAWQIAVRLAERGVEVDVLTSCSESFQSDWSKSFYTAGEQRESGITIKRFEPRERERERFDLLVRKLLSVKKKDLIPGVSPLSTKEEEDFIEHSIYAPDLQYYIETHREAYDLFLFLPYLFPNIINGVTAAGDRAVLQPCLHDEAYAYLQHVQENFLEAGALFFNSTGEYELAKRLYGPSIISRSTVVYEGVEVEIAKNVKYERYLLYLGRRDEGKNVHLLIESFDTFIEESGSDLQLLIAGIGELPLQPKHTNIKDLGLVSDREKEHLLAGCLALVNPSENESFSRVIFESWYSKKPILIHRECLATYNALQEAGSAGLAAGTKEEWINNFRKIDTMSLEMLKIMGETGFAYARKVADWDRVIDRYIDTFKRIIADYNHRDPSDKKQSIHQLLPNLAYGDAISSQALMIRELLLSEGYDSHIYAQNIDPRVKAFCKPLKDIELNPSDALIYHHSIGFDRVDLITGHPGKKALIYHNITPKDFFEDYNTQVAAMLTDGRKHLKDLAAVFDYNYGVSDFNCDELRLKGFKDPRVLPLLVSSEKWNFLPDAHTIKLFSDHKKNILFTGRISPNKKQTDLVKMMYHLKKIDPDTRLILVGGGKDERDPYYMELKSLIHDAHLEHDIIITNQISEAELKAFFMVSDLFVSMSEHEGFGVPLVEAMWFDIPVLAYKSTAVPETLGEAGIMFVHKKEMGRVAGVAKLIMSDKETGDAIIGAQRVVRENYSHSTVRDDYLQMIKDLADA